MSGEIGFKDGETGSRTGSQEEQVLRLKVLRLEVFWNGRF